MKWNRLQPNGQLKDMACRELLRRLEQKEYIVLPPPKANRRARVRNLDPYELLFGSQHTISKDKPEQPSSLQGENHE
jgi:hypothetical protein